MYTTINIHTHFMKKKIQFYHNIKKDKFKSQKTIMSFSLLQQKY